MNPSRSPRLLPPSFVPIARGLLLSLAVGASAIAQPASPAPAADELIKNGALVVPNEYTVPEGWTPRGRNFDFVRVIPKPGDAKGGMLEISAENAGVQQVVALSSNWRTLELRFRMKTEGVVPGDARWKNARMALRFINDSWTPLAPWPKNVGKSGTHDWTDHVVTLVVPAGATALVVEPAMFGDSGTVWFSDISLRVIEAD